MIDAEKIELPTDRETEIDAVAGRTKEIATYCSAADWALSANEHLHSDYTPLLYRRDEHWVGLSLGHHADIGPFLQPLEGEWGFASPILGPRSEVALQLLVDVLSHLEGFWQITALSGLPPKLARKAAQVLGQKYRVLLREGIEYQVAQLGGGVDGFLSRRSPRFRANLRRDARRARDRGIRYQILCETDDCDALMDRMLAVDRETWKQEKGVSIFASPRHQAFYRAAAQRAAKGGRLRAAFAQMGDRDVAYAFGGILHNQYRGFQLGYAQELKHLGLGNQVQFALLKTLCDAGIQSYDLGMAMDYKSRWSDEKHPLYTVIVINPQRAAVSNAMNS